MIAHDTSDLLRPRADATRERGEWTVPCPECGKSSRISSNLYGLTITVCPAGHECAVPRMVGGKRVRPVGVQGARSGKCEWCDTAVPRTRTERGQLRTPARYCSDACRSAATDAYWQARAAVTAGQSCVCGCGQPVRPKSRYAKSSCSMRLVRRQAREAAARGEGPACARHGCERRVAVGANGKPSSYCSTECVLIVRRERAQERAA